MKNINEIDKKTLLSAKPNKKYIIKNFEILSDNTKLLLNNLGICKDESVVVLKSNYGKSSLLVNVAGINFTLDKNICEGIIVE